MGAFFRATLENQQKATHVESILIPCLDQGSIPCCSTFLQSFMTYFFSIGMFPFVNTHTHSPGEGINVWDVGMEIPVREIDQRVLFSVGIHPMEGVREEEVDWSRFRSLVADERVVAIGECGLDRRFARNLREQERLFWRQAECAEEADKPMVIHGVKAYPEIIATRKAGGFRKPWVIHGYNNNGRILTQLLEHGFYISAGAALLNPDSNVSRWLKDIPLKRLFLETDDRKTGIGEVYAAASCRLGLEMEELRKQLWVNFNTVFHGMVE